MDCLLCVTCWGSVIDKAEVPPAFRDLIFGFVGGWEIRQQDFAKEDSRP